MKEGWRGSKCLVNKAYVIFVKGSSLKDYDFHMQRRKARTAKHPTLCSRFNVCILLKFLCWNPKPWWDGIRRCGHLKVIKSCGWEPFWMGLVPLLNKDLYNLSHLLCTIRIQRVNSGLYLIIRTRSGLDPADALILDIQLTEV